MRGGEWNVWRLAMAFGLMVSALPMRAFAEGAAATGIYEPNLPGGKATVKLPEEASNVQAGGAGRYLVLHLKKSGALAVFDVCEAKVAHFIQLPAGEVHYAVGQDRVFVASSEKNSITRYNLATGNKEISVAGPEGGVQWMGMGAASMRPLIVASEKKTLLMDPMTLHGQEMHWDSWGGRDNNWPAPHMRVSGDGRSIVAWGGGGAGLEVVTVDGQKVVDHKKGGYIHDAEGAARISFDGQLLFVPGNVFGPDVKDAGFEIDGYGIGTMSPNYFLALKGEGKGSSRRGGGGGKNAELKFYLAGEKRSIWTMKDVGEFAGSALPPEQRLWFIPAANVLVGLAAGNNQIHVRRFNVVDALDAAGIDYLFVNSTPPATAERGRIYSYRLDVMSKVGGVQYALASAPKNMTISPAGVVAWTVPAAFKEDEFKVIVSVKDKGGQEIFQPFTVRVEKPGSVAPPPPPGRPVQKGTRA